MMENQKGKHKTGIIVISVIFVLAAAAVILFLIMKKDGGYRLIQVYEVWGSAIIERENVGSMEAYENLNLKSKDLVQIMKDSQMRLKMDEDKYMLAEEESIFRIFATGTSENSKTDLKLEQGAVTVEIENKLSDGSSYKVTTPNSVMAVRGTAFRTALEENAEGEMVTRVTCFAGSVSVAGLDKEGNPQKEQMIKSGKEALVTGEKGDTVITVQDVTEEAQNPGGPTTPEGGEEPAKEPQPDTLLVTFEYEGQVFGTQKVKYGEKAQKPKLWPAPAGSWDFDFNTPITEDIVISFKAS